LVYQTVNILTVCNSFLVSNKIIHCFVTLKIVNPGFEILKRPSIYLTITHVVKYFFKYLFCSAVGRFVLILYLSN